MFVISAARAARSKLLKKRQLATSKPKTMELAARLDIWLMSLCLWVRIESDTKMFSTTACIVLPFGDKGERQFISDGFAVAFMKNALDRGSGRREPAYIQCREETGPLITGRRAGARALTGFAADAMGLDHVIRTMVLIWRS